LNGCDNLQVVVILQNALEELGGGWMNQKSQFAVGFFQVSVVLGALVFFTSQCFAGVSSIYKWKDEQGKVHFTDDPLKIPLKHRLDHNLEKIRGLPPVKSSSKKTAGKGNSDSTSEDQNEEGNQTDNTDTDEKKADKKEKELASMREALGFLKSDVQRYKKYDEYVPQHRHAVVLREEIVTVIPAKEALAKKLEESDSALLKQVSSYLKTSLKKDYETKKREHPRRLIFISERTRLNGEQSIKSSLIEKLNAKLKKSPEKTSQKPKPQKSSEPAKELEQDASKTTRKYGGY
jgi:hypothetical protein